MSSLPATASDLFDTLMPLGIAAYPEKIRDVGAIILFKIEGEGGGKWTLDCTSTPPRIVKGDSAPESQVSIEMEHEDFKKLMVDHNQGINLYFEGKIRVTGEANLAIKLGGLFNVTRPYPG